MVPVRLIPPALDQQDPEPKASACDGVLRAATQTMLWRVGAGRLVSGATTPFRGGVATTRKDRTLPRVCPSGPTRSGEVGRRHGHTGTSP